MRQWIFYGFLLSFLFFWFVLFKPYEVGSLNSTPTTISFEKFFYSEYDQNRTRIHLTGQYGQYFNKRIYIKELFAKDPETNETLQADKGEYGQDLLKLRGDVHYRSPQYKFNTQKADYYTKIEKLVVPVKFWLYAKEYNATGVHLVYFKSSGKIVADKIHAKVLFQ